VKSRLTSIADQPGTNARRADPLLLLEPALLTDEDAHALRNVFIAGWRSLERQLRMWGWVKSVSCRAVEICAGVRGRPPQRFCVAAHRPGSG
jgi:hypothetical protein